MVVINMREKMNNYRFILLSIFMLFLSSGLSSTSIAQNYEQYDGPGISIEYPETHMLFLKGAEENPILDRNWSVLTGLPQGSASFNSASASSSPNLLTAKSAPLEEPFRFDGNISISLFASLEGTGSNSCKSTSILPSPVSSETEFQVTLSMGGIVILDEQSTNVISMSEGYTSPHEFIVLATDVNVSMGQGDTIDISINVRHECIESGSLWWGTYDIRSGITFEGDFIEIELDAIVDANRMVRIELMPISPWGIGDFTHQIIEIVGPTDWSRMYHGEWDDEDLRQYHFEDPQGTRIGDANRTILTWTSDEPLEPGNYMVDVCIDLSDQNPGDNCNLIVVLRFVIPEDPVSFINSDLAIFIIPLGIMGWIVVSLRGAMLPLPAYGVIILLAFASLGPAMNLPDINNEPYRDNGAAPSFILLSHNPDTGSVSLSDLLDKYDVVVIGMFQHGSPNALLQYNDFSNSIKYNDKDIGYVQIATGEDLRATDLDYYSRILNNSWPLLLDEADSNTGLSLPNSASDAVIIIDSAGFISEWQPGSMSSVEIEDAAIKSSWGSGNNPLKIISSLFSMSLLPLIVLAMPRDRKFKFPEGALIPGAGSLLILYASIVGFSYWAIPVALLASLGAGTNWIWVELFLTFVLIYHGLSILKNGKIKEIEMLSKFAYSKLPQPYKDWKEIHSFTEDAYLGLWLSWLLWIQIPFIIPQGVGAIAQSGPFGIILSVFALSSYILCSGICVIIARNLALIFGPISRIFGEMSIGLRPRAWGLASTIFGVWIMLSILLGPLL